MASEIKLTTAVRDDMLDLIVTAIGASGLLRIYDGTKPAGPGTAISTQTLLAELALSATAGTVSAGVLTFGTITTDSSANASGTASWFRVTTSAGTAVLDGTVSTSGADLNLNTLSIVSGGPVAVSSLTITAPGG